MRRRVSDGVRIASPESGSGRGRKGKFLAAVAPWERPDTIALSGELNLSRRRAALDDAAISFGDHAAKGSLALDMTGVRPRLEGTIAYDTLDVTPAWISASGNFAENPPLAALPLARRETDRPLDFDLRVSADRFRAASFETGPLALALTQIQDRLSVDIASVAVFGGHATGRLDVNPGQPASLSLRTSGSQLDAKALAGAFQLPLGFSGPVMLQAVLTMPVTIRHPAEDVALQRGHFRSGSPQAAQSRVTWPRRLAPLFSSRTSAGVFAEVRFHSPLRALMEL